MILTKKFLHILIFSFLFISNIFIFMMRVCYDIPNYAQLVNYKPPAAVKICDISNKLIDRYKKEKRAYIKYNAIPKIIISAFVSTEDKNFFSNIGIEYGGILRALLSNALSRKEKKQLAGGSTITQQVVKVFFLQIEKVSQES